MKKKNNLDEMQEKKLLKIEHNGFWLAFWGLMASIYAQIAMGNTGFEAVGGECIVLTVISVYLLFGCVRNGIWDRKLKPGFKSNLLVSVTAGAVFGAFWAAVSYHRYHAWQGSLATGAVMFLVIGGVCFLLLCLTTAAYRRRCRKLEAEADLEEEDS